MSWGQRLTSFCSQNARLDGKTDNCIDNCNMVIRVVDRFTHRLERCPIQPLEAESSGIISQMWCLNLTLPFSLSSQVPLHSPRTLLPRRGGVRQVFYLVLLMGAYPLTLGLITCTSKGFYCCKLFLKSKNELIIIECHLLGRENIWGLEGLS